MAGGDDNATRSFGNFSPTPWRRSTLPPCPKVGVNSPVFAFSEISSDAESDVPKTI